MISLGGRGNCVSARARCMNVSAGIAGPEEDVTREVGAAEGGSTDPLNHGHYNPFQTAT